MVAFRIVKAAVARRLIDLNKAFYQNLAAPFSASRGRLQPGVQRILEGVPAEANILDLGCGNGSVARELARGGHQGQYLGLDFSEELLNFAGAQVEGPNFTFAQADLTAPDWHLQSPVSDLRFDFVLAFAVLHHVPSGELRMQLVRQVRSLLEKKVGGSQTRPYEGGQFIHSSWQFLNSPRLQARIQPWETIGLSAADVDEGDYLLDWRSGGQGLRYVHHFEESELADLAREAGFSVAGSFYSDGKEGKLALYQTWKSGEIALP